jgi:hypothetical protein
MVAQSVKPVIAKTNKLVPGVLWLSPTYWPIYLLLRSIFNPSSP